MRQTSKPKQRRSPARPGGPRTAIGRTQALVLGFFALAWISLATILLVAPAVYDRALKLPDGDHRAAEILFLVALSAFLVLLAVGVLRRWRWPSG